MGRLRGVIGLAVACSVLSAPVYAQPFIAPTARFGAGVGIPYGMVGVNTEVGFNILGLKLTALGGIGAVPGFESRTTQTGRVVGLRAGLASKVFEPRFSFLYGTVGYAEQEHVASDGQRSWTLHTFEDWAAGIGARINISKSVALEGDVLYTPQTFDGVKLYDGIRVGGRGTVKGSLGLSVGF